MRLFKLVIIIIFTFPILFNYTTSFSKIQNNNSLITANSSEDSVNNNSNPKKTDKSKAKKSEDVSLGSKTVIKAKTINIKRNIGQIEFNDDAIVENADTSILSDKIIVYYDENKKKSNPINHIDAIGNVKIFNQEFVATGDRGSYDPKNEIFTITRNVVFNNGTSIAHGEKFIYEVRTRKGFLTGAKEGNKSLKSDRVTVIINQSK